MAKIDVYSWPTPNGHKVHIMLEECGLPYQAIPVDIGAGEQFRPAFLEVSPNNKIPAIVDPQGPDGEPISSYMASQRISSGSRGSAVVCSVSVIML